jgi:hypothetical protein
MLPQIIFRFRFGFQFSDLVSPHILHAACALTPKLN